MSAFRLVESAVAGRSRSRAGLELTGEQRWRNVPLPLWLHSWAQRR